MDCPVKSLGVSWNWNGSACERLHTVNFQDMLYFYFNLQIATYWAENLAHNPQFQGNKQRLFLHLITLESMWKEESHTCTQTVVCT